MKTHLKVRHLLANQGKELTPAEAEVFTEKLRRIYDSIDEEMVDQLDDMDIEEEVKGLIRYVHRLKTEGLM